MNVVARIPYKGGPSALGIHYKSAKLNPTCGQPIFVGAKGDVVGVYLDNNPDVPGVDCMLWKSECWEHESVPWQDLYLDLRTTAGLFAAACWLAEGNDNDRATLFQELVVYPKPRAAALAHVLTLRKINGMHFALSIEGDLLYKGVGVQPFVDLGGIYDSGSGLTAIIGTL